MYHNKLIHQFYTASLLFVLISFSACKKNWLDEPSNKNINVPSNAKEFQAMLDFTSRMNANVSALGETSSDGHYVAESVWPSASSIAKNAYSWSNTQNNQPYTNLTGWNSTYNRVLVSNIVLDELMKIQNPGLSEQAELDNVKGQALFNRADAFFSLSQIYGQPFNAVTSVNDLSIPLRLESDLSIPSVRASVQQVYDRVIGDLNEAAVLLPPTALAPTRGSKASAYGLLARVYLTMGKYDEALENANKSLQLYSTLLDYTTLPSNASFIGSFNSPVRNTEIVFYNRIESFSFITTSCLIDASLYNEYVSDDLRKTKFFRQNSNNTYSYIGNYNSNATNLFCGIATDELYLIKAECQARKGDASEAMITLNNLLRTRWKKIGGVTTYVDQTAATSDIALTKILTERRKELLLRGLRWSDLRRLNADDRFKTTITRTIGGITYTLDPGSFKYTFPLPQDVLGLSTMPQTPGW